MPAREISADEAAAELDKLARTHPAIVRFHIAACAAADICRQLRPASAAAEWSDGAPRRQIDRISEALDYGRGRR
jgi:hypothetical protein